MVKDFHPQNLPQNAIISAMPEIALITGTSAGIGLAIARKLRSENILVAGIDLNPPPLDSNLNLFIAADVSEYDQCKSAWVQVSHQLGPPTILINNAGIIARTSILETSPDQFWRVLHTNLGGTYNFTRIAAEDWISTQTPGRIINLSSGHAWIGGQNRSAYAASKAAIEALTRNTAVELGQHQILVNAVSPGFTDTEMSKNSLVGDRRAMVERRLPIRRIADPAEVAQAVFALATNQIPYMTGQTLRIDGGWSNSDVDYSQLKPANQTSTAE